MLNCRVVKGTVAQCSNYTSSEVIERSEQVITSYHHHYPTAAVITDGDRRFNKPLTLFIASSLPSLRLMSPAFLCDPDTSEPLRK